MGGMTSYPIPRTYPPSQEYGNHVLIASPSTVVRQRVLESLRSPLRRFEQASGGAEALVHLESGTWQVLFLDRRLPDLDAEELSLTVRQRYPDLEVVLLDDEDVALGDGRGAGGAIDGDFPLPPPRVRHLGNEALLALAKPPESEMVTPGLAFGMEKSYLPNAIEDGAEAVHVSFNPLPGMIGDSIAMQPVYRLTRLLAARTTTVLITGPTGCGKEMVARAVHQLSSRSNRAFAVVNCAAIPETMLEAELFGYARAVRLPVPCRPTPEESRQLMEALSFSMRSARCL
jgi:DNA-binding NtrC family response regulator